MSLLGFLVSGLCGGMPCGFVLCVCVCVRVCVRPCVTVCCVFMYCVLCFLCSTFCGLFVVDCMLSGMCCGGSVTK